MNRLLGAIEPESVMETAIVSDPVWIRGVNWDRPRPGHPEGPVIAHVIELLHKIDRSEYRERHAMR